MKNILLITLSVFCLSLLSVNETAADNIKTGNRLFEQNKYDEAAEKYKDANEEGTDSDIANFNLGTALYKKGEYEEAINAFSTSLATEDRSLEAKANYNIANSKYMLGRQILENDISGAADLYRGSLDYFKRAIELDEKDDDARYNHELVEKNLKILLDKLKKQQKDRKEEENKSNDQKDKNSDSKKSGKDKKKNDEEQEDKQDGKSDDSGKKEEQSENGNSQAGDADKDKSMEKPASQDKGENIKEQPASETDEGYEMSPEEARMLLDSLGDQGSIERPDKKENGYFKGVLKEW